MKDNYFLTHLLIYTFHYFIVQFYFTTKIKTEKLSDPCNYTKQSGFIYYNDPHIFNLTKQQVGYVRHCFKML